MTVYVDVRYGGHHGIGRYASELLPRLDVPLTPLALRGTPTSPRGLLSPGWWAPRRTDLVYSPGFVPGPTRARQLLTLHDLIHRQGSGDRWRGQKAMYDLGIRPVIRRTGHVITGSEAVAEELRQWLDDETVQVHAAGYGCSTAFTVVGPRHDIGRPYVLFVGNARPHKNFRLVAQAMAFLPDVDLLAVGPDERQLRAIADDVGTGSRLRVVAGLSDEELAAHYRGATMLLFPSTSEGYGLPALEAISCGTPVLYAMSAPTVAGIVGDAGFGVDAKDARGAAEAVERAGQISPDTLAARASGHSWDAVAKRVSTVISLVDEEPSGDRRH